MVERLRDIIEDIRERTQNPFNEKNRTPFAGAFIIATLIYNWELVFSLISFDEDDTRMERIRIITYYLNREHWFKRLSFSVLLALCSIVLFYVFNNISLGVTVFFNRWVKSGVLYFTDNSSIVSKEDYEKLSNRASSSKKRLDALKMDLSQSEGIRASLDDQLTELTNKFNQLEVEHEKLKDRARLAPDVSGVHRVAYARYGPEGVGSDVTVIVRQLLAMSGQFTVDNKTFDGDPVPYDVKNLFVIYEHRNIAHTLQATEGEIVRLTDQTLKTEQTELSKKKQMYLLNQKVIADIFSGSWILNFSARGGDVGQEPVIIDESGRYFAHFKHRFYLRTITIDNHEKKITFNKVDLKRRLHTKEVLTMQNNDLITGTDSKGYSLEYRRQKMYE